MKIIGQELSFIVLNKKADVSLFRCTDQDLNEFIRQDALADQNALLSVTRLVYYKGDIVGFFTLVNSAIKTGLISPDDGEIEYGYTYYPAIKIARLATHRDHERCGIGRAMLQRTIAISYSLSKFTGCRFICIDSKINSIEFYLKYGFKMPVSIAHKLGKTEVMPLYKDLFKALYEVGHNQ
jgi:GNAT superfamily N-acetyltransferase